MPYGLMGKFVSAPGSRDQMVAHLVEAAERLGDSPGCLHYRVSTSDEPVAIWVSEVWTDKDAHAASLQSTEIRALIDRARPLIVGMSDRTELTVVGGKGLPST